MLLAADPTQDLYDSASKWTDEAMTGAGFSGSWLMLEDNYRLPKTLSKKTNEFAENFARKGGKNFF